MTFTFSYDYCNVLRSRKPGQKYKYYWYKSGHAENNNFNTKYSDEEHGKAYIDAINIRHPESANAALHYYRIMRRRRPSKYPIMGGTMMKLRSLMANRWRVE